MQNSLEELTSLLQRREAEASLVAGELREKQSRAADNEEDLAAALSAQQAITEASRLTQRKVKGYIEALVTKAVAPIFDRPFRFVLEYDVKGRKTVAQPLVVEGEGGEPQIPKEEMGVSILDILSFAMRVVLKRLERPRTRELMILDEPMRDVGKGRFLERAADMLREMSQRLGLQLIIITHEAELARIGDAVFTVTHNGVESRVVKEGAPASGKPTFNRIEL